MAAKVVSQKKFAKLVAATGSLSQPPGALTRISNLLFTTRGSLQIADGSASIGALLPPFLSPAWVDLFNQFDTGQYPLYSVLSNTSGALLANFPNASFTAAPTGTVTNPTGTYYFVVVALGTQGALAINNFPSQAQFTAASAFAAVDFSWPIITNATGYDVYYLASPSASVGNKILSNVPGTLVGSLLTATFTGALTPDTTAFPSNNTSYLLQLLIGAVTPPSPTVEFVLATDATFPANIPQPAQLAPGDPKFQFDLISTLAQVFLAGTIGSTVSLAAPYGPPTVVTGLLVSGWASHAVPAAQSVVVTFTADGDISFVGTGTATVSYQYSLDSGSTWHTFYSTIKTNSSAFTWTDSLTCTIPPAALADLNTLQFCVSIRGQSHIIGGEVDVDITPNAPGTATTTTFVSFSPYGGVVGLACNVPQEVQFAGVEILVLGNGYPPQSCDPTDLAGCTPAPLTNSFTAAFPTWQASVSWITGALVTDGAGNYFIATQGGVSDSTTPTWATAQGDQTPDGSVLWTSQGPIAASTAPRGAAHAVAYAGSLWLANTYPATTSDGLDGPTCLKMSDANNPNSWNPVNTAFIGRNDGTQITGLQPFTIAALGISPTGSLCVFKEYQTYQVIGVFGSASFEIQPAQTNLGCIAPRSIQFLPGFGVVRFSHLGFAVFDGINDRLISEDIRPYLFGGVDSQSDLNPVDPAYVYLSQSAQTIAPPMYLCAMPLLNTTGSLTRLFCYDLVMKSWTVLDLPWAITSLNATAAGEGYPLVIAGKTDGTLQRMQAGDLTWAAGASDQSNIQWGFRSPDLFGEGSSQRLFYKMVVIRGYGNSSMVASIVANLWLDGKQIGAQAIDIVPMGGGSLFEARVKIFLNGERAHIDISGHNGGAGAIIDAADWSVVPKSTQARRIIG
jgi:hypothetical protein